MKKIGRSQKFRIIERVKTFILVLLFLGCILLGYQIFETYREQTIVENFWWGTDLLTSSYAPENVTDKSATSLFQKISEPECIILNINQSREELKDTASADFKEISGAVIELLYEGYKLPESSILSVTSDEWKNAVRAKSVYVKYPTRRSIAYEAAFYGISGSELLKNLDGYKELAVIPENENAATLLIRDEDSDRIVKLKLNMGESKIISDVLAKYEDINKKDHAFAYELNLDEITANGVVLNSMLKIPTTGVKADEIIVDIPKPYRVGLNFTKTNEFITGLINIFGYNPNTVRQYVNRENALIFVGETGSVSVYPQGRIEYKALTANEGISLAVQGQSEAAASTLTLCNIMEKIMRVSGINPEECGFDIKMSKMPRIINNAKKSEICFDYFVDGIRVKLSKQPAVCAVIENGMLTEFVIEVRMIEKSGNETIVEDLFAAIDRFCNDNKGTREITQSDLIYQFKENGDRIKAEWDIKGEY